MRKLNALLEYLKFILNQCSGGCFMPKPSAPPRDVEPEAVRAMLAESAPGDVTVLDVRQGWEYEEFHLPGAKLLPLGELEDRAGEVPKDKPVLVYCHSGRRSAAAASLLAGMGRSDVMNMPGGVMAWKGATAVGSPQTGMQYRRGDETPGDILALAFAMERELGAFYHRLAENASDPELKALFKKLAGFEDKHKQVVYHIYKTLFPESPGIEDLASKATSTAMEGGRPAGEVLAEAKGFESTRDALDMAMGIEAQALDLYMRYASVAANVETMNTLFDLAKEERGHLRSLGSMMDRLGTEKKG